MSKFIVLLILFICFFAQSFDEFKNNNNQQFESFKSEFDDLLDYMDRDSFEYQKRLKEIELIWGDKKLPSKKEWVAYSNDKKQRISINYEMKSAKIEIQNVSDKKSALQQTSILVSSMNKSELHKNVISDIINIEKINENNLKKNSNNTYEIKLPFKKSAFNKLVENVIPIVKKYSKKYKLDPIRVLAQIHTESAFNPFAVSSAQAYGLMQLVPHSGGKEAFTYLKKKPSVPSKKYLFDKDQNIELGCIYIHILNSTYFKDVSDHSSKEFITISAYNTGPTNVRKTLNQIKHFKALPSEQIYNLLINNLPHKETREYLITVQEKKVLYTKI